MKLFAASARQCASLRPVFPVESWRLHFLRAFSTTNDDRRVGFGIHRDLTYAQVLARHPAYCDWVIRESAANPEFQHLQAYIEQCRIHLSDQRPLQSSVIGNCNNSGRAGGRTFSFGASAGFLGGETVARIDPTSCYKYQPAAPPLTPSTPKLFRFPTCLRRAGNEQCTTKSNLQGLSCFQLVAHAMQAAKLRKSGGHPDMRSFQELAATCRRRMDAFNCQQLSILAVVFSIHTIEDSLLWRKLAIAVSRHVDDFSTKQVANLAQAFAKAGRDDVDLFSALASAALRLTPSFSEKELTNIVWAFARISRKDAELFAAVAEAGLTIIETFTPQGLSNMVWAFARLSQNAPDLFDAVSTRVVARIGDFQQQNLANTVWAFAKVGRHDPEVFQAVATAATRLIHTFIPQGLANVAWAFAKAGRNDTELFQSVAAAVLLKVHNCIPQELCMLSWAFAKVGVDNPHLFDSVAAAGLTSISWWSSTDLANTAWAFATIGRNDAKLFAAIAAAALPRISHFLPQELSNTAWAFAKMGRNDPELFEAISAAVLPRIREFNGQNIANTLWAFVKLGRGDAQLFDCLASAALRSIGSFNSPELSTLAWAFAHTNLKPSPTSEKLLNAIVAQAYSRGWLGLSANLAPQRSGTIEARCADLVLRLVPDALRNRYHAMGFELDIVIETNDGALIDLEIDELYHRDAKQRSVDARRDRFLQRLGVRVMRFDAFDAAGHERADLEEALIAELRGVGLLG
ncbi:unnamed protein product [Polarella glacialis]|nr:unnamed protein product [Polarella glacialis]